MKTIIGFLVVSFFLFSPGPALANVDEVATNEGGSVEFIECGPMVEATAPLQVTQANVCPANPDGSCVNEGASCGPLRKIKVRPACITDTLTSGKMICHCTPRGIKKR